MSDVYGGCRTYEEIKGKVKFVSFRDEDVVEKYELSQELQSKMEQRLYILKIISGMTAFIAYMY